MKNKFEIYIKSLSDTQKLEVYMDYYTTLISLKYDFYIRDIESEYIGWGKEDKKIGNCGLHFLWKNTQIMSFQEFCRDENIINTDVGENWKERGYASRIITQYLGIYNWLDKHPELIKK